MNKKVKGRPLNPTHSQMQKDKILISATKLFSKNGYNSTEIQLVADKAKIAKGTVYLYFKSKKELFLATVDRVMILLREQLHKDLDVLEDPVERIKCNIKSVFTFFDKNPDFVELFIQERAIFDNITPAFFKHGQHEFNIQSKDQDELIKAGKIRDISREALFTFFSDLIYGAIMNKVSKKGKFVNLSQKTDFIIDICLNGIIGK